MLVVAPGRLISFLLPRATAVFRTEFPDWATDFEGNPPRLRKSFSLMTTPSGELQLITFHVDLKLIAGEVRRFEIMLKPEEFSKWRGLFESRVRESFRKVKSDIAAAKAPQPAP